MFPILSSIEISFQSKNKDLKWRVLLAAPFPNRKFDIFPPFQRLRWILS